MLPKLGNISSINAESSSLANFAATQLKNSMNSVKISSPKAQFSIPKLFPSKKTEEPPTDEIKKFDILIDLKSALVPETEKKKVLQAPQRKSEEVFIPQFVDCDLVMDVGTAESFNCESVSLKELKLRFTSIKFKKFSVIGKIIGRKLKKKSIKVHHGYTVNPAIHRFAFDVPSPDDKILANLNKIKKKF